MSPQPRSLLVTCALYNLLAHTNNLVGVPTKRKKILKNIYQKKKKMLPACRAACRYFFFWWHIKRTHAARRRQQQRRLGSVSFCPACWSFRYTLDQPKLMWKWMTISRWEKKKNVPCFKKKKKKKRLSNNLCTAEKRGEKRGGGGGGCKWILLPWVLTRNGIKI